MVFESRKPCAADRSGFSAKPAGRPQLARPTGTQGSLAYEPDSPSGTSPPGFLTEQNLRKQKLHQYQF